MISIAQFIFILYKKFVHQNDIKGIILYLFNYNSMIKKLR